MAKYFRFVQRISMHWKRHLSMLEILGPSRIRRSQLLISLAKLLASQQPIKKVILLGQYTLKMVTNSEWPLSVLHRWSSKRTKVMSRLTPKIRTKCNIERVLYLLKMFTLHKPYQRHIRRLRIRPMMKIWMCWRAMELASWTSIGQHQKNQRNPL